MLPATLGQQMAYCLTFALLGAALGVVYDVLRAVRVSAGLRVWGTRLLDGLFCLMATVGFLLTMLRHTDGRLRGYLLLGLAGGFWLYRETVSYGVYRLLRAMLRAGGILYSRLCAWVLWMFSFPRGN